MPPYVSLAGEGAAADHPGPGYLGATHRGCSMRVEGAALDNADRQPRDEPGAPRRAQDPSAVVRARSAATWIRRGEIQGLDGFRTRAFDMLSSPRAAMPSISARNRRRQGPGTVRPRTSCSPAAWSKPACRWSIFSEARLGRTSHDIFPLLAGIYPRSTRSVHALHHRPCQAGFSTARDGPVAGRDGPLACIGTEPGRPTGRDHWRRQASP